MSTMDDAKDWIMDCNLGNPYTWDDSKVIAVVNQHCEGGWGAFVALGELTQAMNADLARLADEPQAQDDWDDVHDEALAWLNDCEIDVIQYDLESYSEVMDRQIRRLVDREYEGGWKQFVWNFRNPLEFA